MKRTISKKARLLALAIALSIGASNTSEVSAQENYGTEISLDDVDLEQRVYAKALEDVVIKDSIDGKVIGTLMKDSELPLNDILDQGYMEITYGNTVGYVDKNLCTTVNRYNCENMIEVINDTTLYKDDNSKININKQEIGILIKKIGSWSMVLINDQIGYVKTSDTELLTNTFVDVLINKQLLRLYKYGEMILESPVITGIEKHETDQGDFTVYDKKKNYKMNGVDQDTGKPYVSYVDYCVMYNNEHKEYIHDAKWRKNTEFYEGEEYHKRNGSHGCINAPYFTAESVFECVDVGDKVLVRQKHE